MGLHNVLLKFTLLIWIILRLVDKGYLSIARNETGFYNLYGFFPDIAGLTIDLSKDGDVLRLKKGNEEIDMVAWENFVSGWDLKADENESIKRLLPDIDTNTSDNWMSNYPDPGF